MTQRNDLPLDSNIVLSSVEKMVELVALCFLRS